MPHVPASLAFAPPSAVHFLHPANTPFVGHLLRMQIAHNARVALNRTALVNPA